MASKTTEPGSAPSCPRTRSAPTRSDHSWSCSAAAARKVSAAAITTLRPDAASRWAILPMLVVFPTPFTPTNIHTLGCPGEKDSDRSAVRSCVDQVGLEEVEQLGGRGDRRLLHPKPEVVEDLRW